MKDLRIVMTPDERTKTLAPLLEELHRQGSLEVIPRRISVCRRVLRLLHEEPPTLQRAGILALLGTLLSQTTRGYGRTHREALAATHEALTAMERLGLIGAQARTQVDLSYLHLTRMDGNRAENTELAIQAGEAALGLVTSEMDFNAWVQALLNLAIAYGRRTDTGLQEGQERSISLLLGLLDSLSLPQHAEVVGLALHNLTSLYLRRHLGNREDNLEQVLIYGERALQLRRLDLNPHAWAVTMHNLAAAWAARFKGDRAENLEKAISLFQQALLVRTRETVPWEWAETMNALGATLSDRIQGQRPDNLEAAIHCYNQALTVRRRRVVPDAWVESQINLALAYLERIHGDRASNVERSIRISRQVLAMLSKEQRPYEWAAATSNLGQALQARLLGNRAASFEESIRILESALEILDRDTAPREWARIKNILGNGFEGLLRGDRTENLEKALSLYEEALEIRQRDTLPWEWAETTHNLATAHREHHHGNRLEILERAISLSEACLSVYTRDSAPDRWAVTLEGLAALYLDRYEGVREENIEKAISLLEQALEVHTRTAAPSTWAQALTLLGTAYRHRVRGDREDNLERAIDLYTQALEIRTRRRAPVAWADTQNNLGLAWAGRQRGDARENQSRAIQAFRRSLAVQTIDSVPEGHRQICRNLGNLLFRMGRWRDAAAVYAKALAAGEILYLEATTPQARNTEHWQRQEMPVRAAFALARQGRNAEAVLLLEVSRVREIRERLERDAAVLRRAPEPARSELLTLRERIAELEAACRRNESLSAREFLALSAELRDARSALRALLESLELLPRDPGTLPTGLPIPVVYLLTTLHGTLALVLKPGAEGDAGIDALFFESLREEGLTAIVQGTSERVSFLAAALSEQSEALAAALESFWSDIRSALVLPIVRHLRRLGHERALLIPCGPLSLLPLPAMALDEMAITCAPSARIPLELAARSEATGQPVLTAVGNPLPSASPLPLALLEVSRSAEHFPADSRKLLLGREASRTAVLDALPVATHLHFACHGVFDLFTPLNSALLLAGKDRLTIRDLLDGGADLSTARLAVLSACQTAMSDQEITDELLGFPAAFLQAGVPAVLGTLWRVGDLVATLLLSDFYRRHLKEGEDPAQALRGAQVRLRDGILRDLGLVELLEQALEQSGGRDQRLLQALTLYRRKPQDSRPFAAAQHWAGFVLWGMNR